MINTKIYSLVVIVITIVCTYFFEWWIILPLLALASFLTKEQSALKASAIALTLTSTIWIIWALIQDSKGIEKVSVLTGKLLMDTAPSMIFIITGLTIGIVSGLAAAFGSNFRHIVYANKTMQE